MLDFEKELEKFTPSPEVDEIEELIFHNDVSDITDIVKEICKDKKMN